MKNRKLAKPVKAWARAVYGKIQIGSISLRKPETHVFEDCIRVEIREVERKAVRK